MQKTPGIPCNEIVRFRAAGWRCSCTSGSTRLRMKVLDETLTERTERWAEEMMTPRHADPSTKRGWPYYRERWCALDVLGLQKGEKRKINSVDPWVLNTAMSSTWQCHPSMLARSLPLYASNWRGAHELAARSALTPKKTRWGQNTL